MKRKTFSELIKIDSFEGRLEYLYIGDKVGNETFGNARWINQQFYKSNIWLKRRDEIIIRDLGCDLGVEGCYLDRRNIIVHHINTITMDDIINCNPCVFDEENLICVSRNSHLYIHYGTKQQTYVERTKNDTCPWRK
ncbi:hypothetical protein SDC9_59470 [bioreactor metagenome]|uniref:Uncharacterized protein n=1 Tax=bioreactor metagenome TaxID=1076179 RepID=A0A644XA85_9ZZZZ